MYLRRLLPGIASMLLLATAPAAAAVTEAMAELAVAATVYLKVDRIFRNQVIPTGGTAFFVSPRGYLITNWHVVAPQVEIPWDDRVAEVSTTLGDIKVVLHSGLPGERTLDARVVALNRSRDLALLWAPFTPSAWLEFSSRERVAVTEPIWAVGYPFGDRMSLAKRNPEVTVVIGRVTSLRHNEKGELAAIQIDAAVNPGSSGGPVLDAKGQVVGVVQSGIRGAATSLAVAPPQLQAFFHRHRVRVVVEPDTVWSRHTPLQVRAFPMLQDLQGSPCRVTLTGSNIDPTDQEIPWHGQEYRTTVAVPPAREGSPSSHEYLLRLTCGSMGAETLFATEISLPVREGMVPRLASERDPSAIMQDRTDLANQAGSRHIRVEKPKDREDTAPKTATSALSDLAAGVKLRRESADVVYDQHAVAAAIPSLNSEAYKAIPSGALRSLAFEYDKAEEACRRTERATSSIAGWNDRYSASYREREEARRTCANKTSLWSQVRDTNLCRLDNATWIIVAPGFRHIGCNP